jgi:hypothetical protein
MEERVESLTKREREKERTKKKRMFAVSDFNNAVQ